MALPQIAGRWKFPEGDADRAVRRGEPYAAERFEKRDQGAFPFRTRGRAPCCFYSSFIPPTGTRFS